MRPNDSDRSPREAADLGRRLAEAEGYRVLSREGREVGVVEHIRYEQHADHPDEVVISRRVLFLRRRGVVSFSEVDSVDPDEGVVFLRIGSQEISRAES